MAKLRDVKYLGTAIGSAVGIVGGIAITVGTGGAGLLLGLRVASASAAAGYYIDNRIRGTLNERGPHPQLRVSGSQPGTPAPWIWGKIRVPGFLLYASDLKVESSSEKGKQSQNRTSERYYTDIAIAFTRSECQEEFLEALYANGAPVFVKAGTPLIADIAIGGASFFGFEEEGECNWSPVPDSTKIRFETSLPAADAANDVMALFRIGMTIDVQSTEMGIPAGDYVLVSKNEKDTPDVPGNREFDLTFLVCKYEYDSACLQTSPALPGTCAIASSVDPTTASLTFTYTPSSDFSPYFDPDEVNYYRGTETQPVDPILEAAHPGETPAYRGTCYMVIPDFEVTKFAAMLPEFEGVINEGTTGVSEILEDLALYSGSSTVSTIDVTDVVENQEDPVCKGFLHQAPRSIFESMTALMEVFDLRMTETFVYETAFQSPVPQFKVKFLRANRAETISIPIGETSARPFGTFGNEGPVIGMNDRAQVAGELVIEYQDSTRSYTSRSTSYYNTLSALPARESRSLNVVLDQKDAEQLAKRWMWEQNVRSDSVQFNSPPSRYGILPGDQITIVDADNGDISCYAFNTELGDTGLNAIQTYVNYTAVEDQPYGVVEDPLEQTPIVGGTQPLAVVKDLSPIYVNEASEFGLYFGLYGTSANSTGDIYVSSDQTTWQLVATRGASAIVGTTTEALGDACGYYWDTTNTLKVQLSDSSQTLTSQDDELVGQGYNWCVVGGEIIGFVNATPQGNGIYHLTRLLRGRRDTKNFMATHQTYEQFVMLPPTGPVFQFEQILDSRYLVPTYVRVTGPGISVDNGNPDLDLRITPQAQSLRPFTATGLKANRYSNYQVCLWCRDRSRVPFRLMGQGGAPSVESGDAERWVAEVWWDGGGGEELIRTLVGCRSIPDSYYNQQVVFEYSQSQQIADFHVTGRITDGSYPDPLTFKVYRLSDTKGEGRIAELEVLGPGLYFETC